MVAIKHERHLVPSSNRNWETQTMMVKGLFIQYGHITIMVADVNKLGIKSILN